MKLRALIKEAPSSLKFNGPDRPAPMKVIQAVDLIDFANSDRRIDLDSAIEIAQGMVEDDNKSWISRVDLLSIIEMLKDNMDENDDDDEIDYLRHQILMLKVVYKFVKLNKITRIYVK